MVVDNANPQGAGRVGLRFPWHSRPDTIRWAPIAAPWPAAIAACGSARRRATKSSWRSSEATCGIRTSSRESGAGRIHHRRQPPGEGRDLRMIRTRSGTRSSSTMRTAAAWNCRSGTASGWRSTTGRSSLTDEHGNGLTIRSASGDVTVRAAARSASRQRRSRSVLRPDVDQVVGGAHARRHARPHQLTAMGLPAARAGDITSHGTPLGPGPGSSTVLIGGRPAWRALPMSINAR